MRHIKIFFVFLLIKTCELAEDLPAICPKMVSRKQWGALPPSEIDYVLIPVKNIIIHHTVSENCYNEETCASLVVNIQNYHMNIGFDDIGYNFLVASDGSVYEGAGWHKVGAHTRGYNTKSLGIAFIGNFASQLPEQNQLDAVKNLLKCGIELGEIDSKYKIFGARQVSSTESPGLRLFQEIQKWPQFSRFPA